MSIKICLISFLFLSGCAEPALTKSARPFLGTIVEITVADKDKTGQFVNNAINQAFAEIERVEGLLSRFKPESDISRINTDAYIYPTKVSPETIGLIEESIEFSRLTGGAFDITSGPLMRVWGFDEKGKGHIPGLEQLKEARSRVGYGHIDIIEPQQSVFLARAGMSLDLGGIAKGYAVDKAAAVLKKEGISSALINAGGDIYALGGRSKAEKWRIALEHPRRKGAVLIILELQDGAVATSGDYQKYIESGQKRFSHIINPKSGEACADVPASVTVLAEDCTSADALATSIFVLGSKKGIELVNQLRNTEAIVATIKENKVEILLSQGLEERLRFKP